MLHFITFAINIKKQPIKKLVFSTSGFSIFTFTYAGSSLGFEDLGCKFQLFAFTLTRGDKAGCATAHPISKAFLTTAFCNVIW